MKSELVVFDVDNTIIDGQSSAELIWYLLDKKVISQKVFLVLFFWIILYKMGLVKNPRRPMEYGMSFIKNKSIREIKDIIDVFFDSRLKNKIFTQAKRLIEDHIQSGRNVILVSNSPEMIVGKISSYFGIKDYLSTKVELDDNGRYTGKIFGDIMYGNRKKSALIEYMNLKNIQKSVIWAYGDHDSDIDLLCYADKPFAVNPNRKLKEFSVKHNWPVLNFK